MPRERWQLPANVNPPDTLCVAVPVPDDPAYTDALFGALYELGQAYNWEIDAAGTRNQVARVWDAIFSTLDLNTCIEGAMITFRFKAGADKLIEYTVNGTTWIDFPDFSPAFIETNPQSNFRNTITTSPGNPALLVTSYEGYTGAAINEFGENQLRRTAALPPASYAHWGAIVCLFSDNAADIYYICQKVSAQPDVYQWIVVPPPYVPPVEPPPPDLTHYLVDNPGALNQRDNNLTPAAGHFGLAITANGQPGVAVVQPTDHPSIDLFNSVATNVAPVLRLSTATNSPLGGFIHLGNQHGDADPITPEFAWRTPPVYTLPLADAAHFGAIMLSGDVAIICVLNYTTGVYSWQPVGGGGIQAIHTAYTLLTEGDTPNLQLIATPTDATITMKLPPIPPALHIHTAYTLLTEGDTPNLQLIATPTDATITMKLPPIPPALHIHTAYTLLTEGDTPNLQLIATPTDATITMKLPPIPPALHIHTAVETLAAGAAPQLQLIASATDATITMKLPPIPSGSGGNCPDTTLPAAGKTKAYSLTVDATGTAIPVKLPVGCVLNDFTVSGVWLNVQAFTTEFIKYTTGQHDATKPFPQYGDLILRVTTGAPTVDGIWTTPSTARNPFSGFTATEDCYAFLEQYFATENSGGGVQGNYGAGQLCVAYTITAGRGYDWAATIRLDQSGYHFTGLNVNGGQPVGFIPGKGISSGPSGWIMGCHIPFTWPGSACTIKYAQMHIKCAVPQSGGSGYLYKGGEFVMLQDFTNPLSTGESVYSRSDLNIPITHDDYIDCSVVGNDQPGNTQEVWFVDFTLAGDGTAPMFMP